MSGKDLLDSLMASIAAVCISIVAASHLRYVFGMMLADSFWVNDFTLIILVLMIISLTHIFNSILERTP